MKIAHVVHSMEIGGAETLVATLCRLQRHAGHYPSIHCIASYGPLGRRLMEEGFPLHLHGPGLGWQICWRLNSHFRRQAPDVVHCHNVGPTLVGTAAARLAGIRTVVTTRHSMIPPNQQVRREFKFWLAARMCKRVVAVSRTTHENLSKGPAAKPELIATIYNCASPSERSRGPLPVAKEGFTLLSVARHTPEKDLPTLLQAVAIARRRRPDLRLWQVGSGALAEQLQQTAASLDLGKHVRFFGERTDIGDWLSHADLFVMSSVSEGLPVALLEAMEAGVPQLVTDVGGMAEVVGMSGGGVLVQPSDPEALAARIVELAGDPVRRAELAARSRSCYLQRFMPERMAAEYLELYRECGAKSVH